MMRLLLFLMTNVGVLVVLSVTLHVLGIEQMLHAQGVGINTTGLLILAAVIGMGGSFISLAISKWMAKKSTGAHVIEQPRNRTERWLLDVVSRQAQAAGIDRKSTRLNSSHSSVSRMPSSA